MAKNPHAQALGALGGAKGKRATRSPEHRAKLAANLILARAARAAQAARVMALAADEHSAMLAARRRIDDHAPRALARDGGTRELPRTTFQGRRPACTAPVLSSAAGCTPSPHETAPSGDSGTEAVRVPGSQPAPRSTIAGPGTTNPGEVTP